VAVRKRIVLFAISVRSFLAYQCVVNVDVPNVAMSDHVVRVLNILDPVLLDSVLLDAFAIFAIHGFVIVQHVYKM
jgi:hypothetical protein